jgi:hypothetical protein
VKFLVWQTASGTRKRALQCLLKKPSKKEKSVSSRRAAVQLLVDVTVSDADHVKAVVQSQYRMLTASKLVVQ